MFFYYFFNGGYLNSQIVSLKFLLFCLNFRSKAINHLTVCMLIVTIGHLMFVIFEDYWSLFGGVVLIGIGQSICGALMSPLTVDIIGVGLLPVGYGILNSLNGMGNAICGVIGGTCTNEYKVAR